MTPAASFFMVVLRTVSNARQYGDRSRQEQDATRDITMIETASSMRASNSSELKCSKNSPYKFLAHHIDNFLFSCYSSFILKKQIPISYLKRRCEIGKEGEQNENLYETFFVGVYACICSFTDCLR